LFNVMPALVVTAAARFGLDDGQIGVVGSSALAGFALVAATSRQWIGRFDWRAVTGAGTALAAISLAVCAFVQSYEALLATFFVTGAGMAFLYTVTIAVVSENHKPDRAFGMKLALEVLLAIATMMVLTGFVTARWGFAGTALTLAAITAVVSLAGLVGIPTRRTLVPPDERFAMARRTVGGTAAPQNWTPWIGLGALLVSFGGFAALWAFLTQIASSFGVDHPTSAMLLTVGLAVSGVAGLTAAGLGDRYGRAQPLIIGMALSIVGIAVLLLGDGVAGYAIGALFAVCLWNFPMAYQMGLIASADPNGRVSVLMPAALAIGAAFGPTVAGALVSIGHSYIPLYALFTVATTASLAAFAVVARRVSNRSAR
jgi:MFS family permease